MINEIDIYLDDVFLSVLKNNVENHSDISKKFSTAEEALLSLLKNRTLENHLNLQFRRPNMPNLNFSVMKISKQPEVPEDEFIAKISEWNRLLQRLVHFKSF